MKFIVSMYVCDTVFVVERTTFTTVHSFPGVISWSEVSDAKVVRGHHMAVAISCAYIRRVSNRQWEPWNSEPHQKNPPPNTHNTHNTPPPPHHHRILFFFFFSPLILTEDLFIKNYQHNYHEILASWFDFKKIPHSFLKFSPNISRVGPSQQYVIDCISSSD